VERQDLPSRILWECPACDEAGVIDGWQGSLDDLSVLSESDEGGGLVQVVIPEKAYQLLLDEIALGQGCERLLYRARSRPEGVELSGNEDDFEQLIGVVAFQANHSATRARDIRGMRYFPLNTGMSSGIGPPAAASALTLRANQQRQASHSTRHTASDRARQG
jgi:hypothetical protein